MFCFLIKLKIIIKIEICKKKKKTIDVILKIFIRSDLVLNSKYK